MDIKEILTADVLDIIFDGRNKAYGAYELRKTYNKRILTALASSAFIVILFYSGYLLAADGKHDQAMLVDAVINLEKVDEPKVEQTYVVQPKPKPLEAVKEIKLATPKIVPDEKVKENEMPPVDEIENAKIGLVNVDGVNDKDLVAPPLLDGDKRILAAPRKQADNPDSLFLTVEIQSEYPGGTSSWIRFIKKTISVYPQEAFEKEIQGTVMVKFIVDREGNVSDVEANSGPAELRETAIKAIKKSGRWIPAEQNGRKVKSYKMQPITFRLGE